MIQTTSNSDGYNRVQDEGVDLPKRHTIDFQGAGVTVTDAGGKTVVNIPGGGGVTPAALTKVDDTNVTLTLGGTPASALLQAVTLTLGWTGTLADSRIANSGVWNAKQDAITLTTLGSSGAATFIANVLNIPTVTLSGLGGVPTTRNITINGTTYDLSADRTWSVGDLLSSGSYSNPTWLTSLAWSKITGTPTTLAGYGITNGVATTRNLTINGTTYDLSADRTWTVGDVLTSGSYANPTWITSLAWSKITGAPNVVSTRTAGVTIDGQGGVISTGSKGYAMITTGGTISHWYLSGKNGEAGSITIDLKVGGTSIVGAGTKPSTSSAQNNDAVPSGWTTTTLASGSRLEFNVDSATSCTWYNLTIVFA